jgi:dTDP-4-amino-4,6-dideoxygalactose transaminase
MTTLQEQPVPLEEAEVGMHIEPLPRHVSRFRRPYLKFKNARSAFKAFLETIRLGPDEKVLLPAYVGWSAREGSGVFDPVAELGLSYDFYRVNDQLHIDLKHLRQQFRTHRIKVLVIIHYFGYVDPGYAEAVSIARKHGAWVLEDEAHAMFTDLVGGVSGRLGDACIFSLHKLLPVKIGGMLLVNQGRECILDQIKCPEVSLPLPWEFDLTEISRRRRENAELLSDLLRPLAGEVDPLWGHPRPGEVPQTYPVLVRNVSRDQLYFALNEAGFGAVSLYHTLINPIKPEDFPVSHQLARQIFNLPVHQDVEPDMLKSMVKQLSECILALSK